MIFKELLRYICNYSYINHLMLIFFFSSRRRHTRLQGDWSSDVCSSDLVARKTAPPLPSVGFAPVRPMDIVRATYDFAEIGRASCRARGYIKNGSDNSKIKAA